MKEESDAPGAMLPAPEMPGRFRHKLKIPGFVRRPRSPKPISTCTLVENTPPVEVVLDFLENLKQNRLEDACQQLIAREEHLFSLDIVPAEGGRVRNEKEEDILQKDYETLLLHLWMAVHDTFSSATSGEHLKILRSAVAIITQQEEQDRHWEGQLENREAPEWRPQQCRCTHNTLLHNMVESRLKHAATVEGGDADNLSTSVKRELCRMGKCLKEDLLRVVRDVRGCYPQEFDVCNLYASFYHQVFSARLTEFARSGLDVDDSNYLLYWVNDYYPNYILKHKEVEGHIKSESLGPLVAEEYLKLLEKQYLQHKEDKVITWVSTALRKEEQVWLNGTRPELIDGYCFCPLAVDVIQVIDGAMREACAILGNEGKAKRIMCQLNSFLISYRRSLEEFMKGRRENTEAIVKANLVSIEQFRDFIVRRDSSLSDDIKTSCLSTLGDLRDSGYGYFTGPIHEELKMQYRRLWTQAWLSGGQRVVDNLLEPLDRQMQHFRDLKPICMEELLGRLHTEIMVVYVKRMMKRKVKLKDREQQETAAKLLCDDSMQLCAFFTEAGSKQTWLSDVLPKMAEVLRLQCPGSIQLEMVTLARDYPDLSCRHVSALLSFKANLTTADVRAIKESLEENRSSVTPTTTTPPFFSKVPVKWINTIV